MANHCIDVVCVGCGRCWCLRGCNYDDGPDPRIAEKAKRRFAANPGEFQWDERCCRNDIGGWYPVCSDGLIMGSD